MGCNGIRVDDRSTATRDHCPYPALGIEDCELQRSTRRTVEFLDVCLLLCEVTTKGRRPDLGYMLLGYWITENVMQAYHGRSTVSRDTLTLGYGTGSVVDS